MELVRPKGYFLLQTRDEYNHNHNHNTNHNTDQKHKLVHFTEELDKLMAWKSFKAFIFYLKLNFSIFVESLRAPALGSMMLYLRSD